MRKQTICGVTVTYENQNYSLDKSALARILLTIFGLPHRDSESPDSNMELFRKEMPAIKQITLRARKVYTDGTPKSEWADLVSPRNFSVVKMGSDKNDFFEDFLNEELWKVAAEINNQFEDSQKVDAKIVDIQDGSPVRVLLHGGETVFPSSENPDFPIYTGTKEINGNLCYRIIVPNISGISAVHFPVSKYKLESII